MNRMKLLEAVAEWDRLARRTMAAIHTLSSRAEELLEATIAMEKVAQHGRAVGEKVPWPIANPEIDSELEGELEEEVRDIVGAVRAVELLAEETLWHSIRDAGVTKRKQKATVDDEAEAEAEEDELEDD